MDIGTAMSVVQTLLAALQCSQLKDFCSKKSLNTQLDQLQRTVARIQAVLKDAELKQVLSEEEKVYIEQLKDAVYEADDLFDELVTLAQQKKLTEGTKDRLMSFLTKFKVDFKMSQKVDKIKQKLDGIAYNNQLLINFKHDPEPIRKVIHDRETCSKVDTVDIIGRKGDLEKLVGVLLQSDVRQDVSFLSIVGIGGLGKTALAQLLYNDQRVKSAFSSRAWTCVSDQDQRQLDIKGILRKILESATETRHNDAKQRDIEAMLEKLPETAAGTRHHNTKESEIIIHMLLEPAAKTRHDDASLELVQSQLGKELFEGKYLLVLDDVWTEDREQWQNLVKFLTGSQKGSWIVVTTRSQMTAKIIDGPMHLLQGLSEMDSLRLFEKAAFGSLLSNTTKDLIDIGPKIVERCDGVPLAIRVAGSLLYGQDKSKWLSFLEFGLTTIDENKKGITPILKLSYHQLESPLKSCFGYCAIFPKDYEIQKKTLIRLWMAQGYIQSSDQRCMEDVAEEYFLVLLRRCFFQDVREDIFGDIESCKIHDLMHDVAKEVAGKEIYSGDAIDDAVDTKVRHICTIRSQLTSYTFNKTCIRSYLQRCYAKVSKIADPLPVDALLANWNYLRALDLSKLHINSLPSSIGKLLHLRYLNMSRNYNLKMLPRQITKMYNLQTLDLCYCKSLKELPEDMSKLVKLRVLDIRGCDRLSFMPRGIGTLSSLRVLTMYVLEANSSPKKLLNSLENIKSLVNLRGDLKIKIGFCKQYENVKRDDGRERGCLCNKAHLTSVDLSFSKEKDDEGRVENDEAIIEELPPHSNLKGLYLCYYQGVRMPKWAREGNTLSNLVNARFHGCPNLQSLGCLGSLQHLKFLQISELFKLECLFDINGASSGVGGVRLSSAEELSFFPSLETLYMWGLPKLKLWWRGVGMRDNDQLLQLPKLKKLTLFKCPNLTATVVCLELEDLHLYNFNTDLGIVLSNRETYDFAWLKEEKRDEKEVILFKRGNYWYYS